MILVAQHAFGILFEKQNYKAQVNNEQETYASSQVSFSNDNLIIKPTTGNYLSGAVVTRRKIEFKYGFVEVKKLKFLKVPGYGQLYGYSMATVIQDGRVVQIGPLK